MLVLFLPIITCTILLVKLDGNYRVITQVTTWILMDYQFTFETIQEGGGGSLEILVQNNHITSLVA